MSAAADELLLKAGEARMRDILTALVAAMTIAAVPIGVQPQAQFYYSDPQTTYWGQMGNAAPRGDW